MIKALLYPYKINALKYCFASPKSSFCIFGSEWGLSSLLGDISVSTDSLPNDFISLLSSHPITRGDPAQKLRKSFRLALYHIVKKIKPEIIIETGSGLSSIMMLQALHENQRGVLYSIDIDPNSKNQEDFLPKHLKKHWKLMIGDSKKKLPKLLTEVDKIQMFLHDSLHSYEHMMFEFQTVWPAIEKNGLLTSHDIFWNSAFMDFSKQVNRKFVFYECLGVIKK